jgi:hypothetical protein
MMKRLMSSNHTPLFKAKIGEYLIYFEGEISFLSNLKGG